MPPLKEGVSLRSLLWACLAPCPHHIPSSFQFAAVAASCSCTALLIVPQRLCAMLLFILLKPATARLVQPLIHAEPWRAAGTYAPCMQHTNTHNSLAQVKGLRSEVAKKRASIVSGSRGNSAGEVHLPSGLGSLMSSFSDLQPHLQPPQLPTHVQPQLQPQLPTQLPTHVQLQLQSHQAAPTSFLLSGPSPPTSAGSLFSALDSSPGPMSSGLLSMSGPASHSMVQALHPVPGSPRASLEELCKSAMATLAGRTANGTAVQPAVHAVQVLRASPDSTIAQAFAAAGALPAQFSVTPGSLGYSMPTAAGQGLAHATTALTHAGVGLNLKTAVSAPVPTQHMAAAQMWPAAPITGMAAAQATTAPPMMAVAQGIAAAPAVAAGPASGRMLALAEMRQALLAAAGQVHRVAAGSGATPTRSLPPNSTGAVGTGELGASSLLR